MTEAARGAAWLRATPLFVLSFLLSAIGNVVPQLHLLARNPSDKEWLLSLILLTGTASAAVGITAARLIPTERSKAALVVLVLAMGAAFSGLFFVEEPLAYGLLNMAVAFSANVLQQRLDLAGHVVAGASGRERNDAAATSLRLMGYVPAPLVFAFWQQRWGIVAMTGALGLVVVLVGARTTSAAGRGVASTSAGGAPNRTDRRMFGFARLMYAALFVFSAHLIYLLDELLELPHPVRTGATALTIVFVVAAAYVAVDPLRSRGADRALLWLAPGSMMATVVALWIVRPDSAGLVQVAAVAIGLVYGVFQRGLRTWTSEAASRGRGGVFAAYNNLANLSALIAFAATSCLGLASRLVGLPYYPGLLLLVLGFSLLAGLQLVRLRGADEASWAHDPRWEKR